MKTLNLLIFALAIAVVLSAFGCGQEQPPAGSKQQSATASKPAKPPTPAPTPTPPAPKKTWPFVNEEEGSGELAQNLVAKNYLLIFDGSGSMQKVKCSGGRPKIDVAKDAVVQWSKTIPPEANLGLYAFHSQGKSVLPLTPGNRDQFIQTIQGIRAGGNTPLTNATAHAYHEFTRQGKKQLGYGDYTIVVVTDGIANDGKLLSQNITSILNTTPITIYSIGFCIGKQHSLNQPGQTIYKAADNPDELRRGLKEVLAESEQFDESQFGN